MDLENTQFLLSIKKKSGMKIVHFFYKPMYHLICSKLLYLEFGHIFFNAAYLSRHLLP